MTCPKCQGLMVRDTLVDGAEHDLLEGYRCVNCGKWSEPLLDAHEGGGGKPNTIDAWYLDGLQWLRRRYSFLARADLDEVEGRYAVAVAQYKTQFNPARGHVFGWLCMKARYAKDLFDRRGKSGADLSFRWTRAHVENIDRLADSGPLQARSGRRRGRPPTD